VHRNGLFGAPRRRPITITDTREIEFTAEALVIVMAGSARSAQGFGLPGARPTGVRLDPDLGNVDVLYGVGPAQQAVQLAAEPLGALLVSYCIRTRIPMPRRADKGIRIKAKCVILTVRTLYDEAPPPETADVAATAAKAVKAWTWVTPERVDAPV
jgi:hypothetical protein